MTLMYSDSSREYDAQALPDIEVFYAKRGEVRREDTLGREYGAGKGWYWWYCFPGCLPESEANGPFPTEEAAIADCKSQQD